MDVVKADRDSSFSALRKLEAFGDSVAHAAAPWFQIFKTSLVSSHLDHNSAHAHSP